MRSLSPKLNAVVMALILCLPFQPGRADSLAVRPSPVAEAASPPVTLAGAVQVVAGSYHSCALLPNGGVKCWGNNQYGELGDGTTESHAYPLDVVGLNNVTALAAGWAHTCALTAEGGVKCWGYNASGQLGNDQTLNSVVPVDVSGLSSGVTAIAAGGDYYNGHTCAITTQGGAKCWGHNTSGQLGDGTTVTSRTVPVEVSGLGSGVVAIDTGSFHTCAVVNSGVQCWGYNIYGQLGDGTTDFRFTPTPVISLTEPISTVALGTYHSCALTTGGGVQCWGQNNSGQLGDGSLNNHHTPNPVSGLASGVSAITAGGYYAFGHLTPKLAHTCALLLSGGVKCWGDNTYGQVGDSTAHTQRWWPTDVYDLGSGASQISAGGQHTCARANGNVMCWGNNWSQQVGSGLRHERLQPVTMEGALGVSGALTLTAGSRHTCAQVTGGTLQCWGNNGRGQLGDGTWAWRFTPTTVISLTEGVSTTTAGRDYNCALLTTGSVKCWGDNSGGQLGDGTYNWRNAPEAVISLTSPISMVATGWGHTCAVTTEGGAKCWGWNFDGQLGDGTDMPRPYPGDVISLTSGVSMMAVGQVHTCVLTTSGGVKCWGNNTSGQLGNGTTLSSTTPVDVIGLSSGVSAIFAGSGHTCALLTTNGVKCWGSNGIGELGDGTFTDRPAPVDVIGLTNDVQTLEVGPYHTCAITLAGALLCWGNNGNGQIGDGTMLNGRSVPTAVLGLESGVRAVAAGEAHTCALLTTGGVQCWGVPFDGQMGINQGWAPTANHWYEFFVPLVGR